MPELPEVETLRRFLDDRIIDQTITDLVTRRDNIRYELQENLANDVIGRSVIAVKRIAKYLVLNLSEAKSLVIHLGMSGRFVLENSDYSPKKHDHIVIELSGGGQLVYNDARRFGMIYCYDTANLLKEKILQFLGPEPLLEDFHADYLSSKLKSKATPIKNAIMDNRLVVGVGNIYASESLFLSHIHPEKKASSLSFMEIEALVDSIKEVLLDAIDAGGTTLKDFVNGDNRPGYFKQELNVYGRLNQDCYICSSKIVKIKQAGRATYFCPNCQEASQEHN